MPRRRTSRHYRSMRANVLLLANPEPPRAPAGTPSPVRQMYKLAAEASEQLDFFRRQIESPIEYGHIYDLYRYMMKIAADVATVTTIRDIIANSRYADEHTDLLAYLNGVLRSVSFAELKERADKSFYAAWRRYESR